MKIAVPSNSPGGLDAQVSEHFGHCDIFTLVDIEDGKIGSVNLFNNADHEHGGCMAPVMALKNAKVNILSAGGMGMRPLAGFQQVGIEVYLNRTAPTVQGAIDDILGGKAPKFGKANVCGGGGGCGGHGHQH